MIVTFTKGQHSSHHMKTYLTGECQSIGELPWQKYTGASWHTWPLCCLIMMSTSLCVTGIKRNLIFYLKIGENITAKGTWKLQWGINIISIVFFSHAMAVTINSLKTYYSFQILRVSLDDLYVYLIDVAILPNYRMEYNRMKDLNNHALLSKEY